MAVSTSSLAARRAGSSPAVDPVTLARVTSLHMVAGRLDAVADGGVVLAANVARERHLKIDDALAMTFSRTGTRRLPVVGLLRDPAAQARLRARIAGDLGPSADYELWMDLSGRPVRYVLSAKTRTRWSSRTGEPAWSTHPCRSGSGS